MNGSQSGSDPNPPISSQTRAGEAGTTLLTDVDAMSLLQDWLDGC
ncbi:hypothetical protein ACFV3E_29565 [Streptomyces sp. NPDC059718]